VDALDLCYTKSHVETFVIISGDSDFSPLVSKLRENDKIVIGVGVKNSTSDLLIANCDEFIFYDDLVREKRRSAKKAAARAPAAAPKASPKGPPAEPPAAGKKTDEEKRQEGLELMLETIEALVAERGGDEKVWSSMVKQALKRRKPGFNESYYGFRSFNGMLEEAERRGSLKLERDEKSGGYLVRLAANGD
jgi:ribosomal protein L12E/L44/L45/RPP1/RPP2